MKLTDNEKILSILIIYYILLWVAQIVSGYPLIYYVTALIFIILTLSLFFDSKIINSLSLGASSISIYLFIDIFFQGDYLSYPSLAHSINFILVIFVLKNRTHNSEPILVMLSFFLYIALNYSFSFFVEDYYVTRYYEWGNDLINNENLLINLGILIIISLIIFIKNREDLSEYYEMKVKNGNDQ